MLVRTLDALLRANVRSGRVVMLALVPIMLVALAGGLAGMHYWRFRIVFVILAILALWFVARREVLAALICPICRQVKRVNWGARFRWRGSSSCRLIRNVCNAVIRSWASPPPVVRNAVIHFPRFGWPRRGLAIAERKRLLRTMRRGQLQMLIRSHL
jgi:hypothetical protein